jgi:ABC-2 type transport system ATP-binding protein
MSQIVIECQNLARSFQSYVKPQGLKASLKSLFHRDYQEKMALKPTHLKLEKGQIIGLVGANGAGKTTLLKLLSGLIYPTQGTARVLGYEPWQRETEFLKKISLLLGQKNQLWWDLPAADSFNLLITIYELEVKPAQMRVKQLCEMLDCTHVLHIPLRRLSLGERMKMEIIGSLIHEPEILFLDEPTIGLDIMAQKRIREFLADYVKSKKPTIILTSHYMDDIAQLAQRLLLISQGSIVYDGSVSEFIHKVESKQQLILSLEKPLHTAINFSPKITLPAYENFFKLELGSDEIGRLLPLVIQQSAIQEIKTEEVDFEDVIRRFFEKDLRISKNLNPQPT